MAPRRIEVPGSQKKAVRNARIVSERPGDEEIVVTIRVRRKEVSLERVTGDLSARAQGEDGGAVELVGWRWGERAGSLRGSFEVLACVEDDAYRGGPVLRLVDSRPVFR